MTIEGEPMPDVQTSIALVTEDGADRGQSVVPNPHLFVLAFPGSGADFLREVLDSHPDLAISPDVDWVTAYYETRTGLNLEGLIAPELVTKWVELKRFDQFEIDRREIQGLIPPGQTLPFKTFLSRLFDLYGKAKRKRLVGSQSHESLGALASLHALWPGTKFVHLIRDGRDACLSFMGRPRAVRTPARFEGRAEDPVSTTALSWRRKVERCRAGGLALGSELYHEVRYEALVARPEDECARLCAFLGVPYDLAMLRFHEGREAAETGLGAKGAWQPVTAGLRDWRTEMPAGDVERFEASAGDLLDELSYPRAAPRPGPDAARRASAVRDAFERASPGPETSPHLSLARRRTETGRSNPFVFIVGCPRSGTTLLQRIADGHPDLAICPETFWVPYYFKNRIGLTPDGMVTSELISRLFDYYKFYRMKIGRDELAALIAPGEPTLYSTFVSRAFDLYGESREKPLVGDKTPDYARNIPTLHQLWPRAKFVHLIRDGREVCLSAINWKRKLDKLSQLFSTWGDDPVSTAAVWWEWHVRLGRAGGLALGSELYHEVRYEALVARPEDECARLCAFLGVPYDLAMLRFHEGREAAETGLGAKGAWQPVTAGLRDWRTEMPAGDVERFEASAGDLLDELSYPRAAPRPGPDAARRASAIRDAFERDTRSLGDWLP